MDVSQLDSKAAPWLKLLTSISYLGIQEELPIPQIAVIGDQSSGKSSLLESISKIPFPKGSGLVTKCPTRITMTRITNTQKLQSQSQSQSQSQERKEIEGQEKQWKAIVTLPKRLKDYENNNNFNRPIYDPNELSKILSLASDIVSDNSPGIFSFDPINVLVEATTIPNLSIIDLPGIIRTTTVGQNKEIINEINELLSHYMKQPETIILAVIPSNQDIATIDVLERAYHYDPNGIRTIGVLTKPDLVDEGSETEILSIMNNKRKPLSLGYYIVKNRNQLELNQNLSVEESIKHELDYFINHSVWKTIDINRVGIKSLCEKLSDIIISRAIERGPYIKWHLEQKNKQITETLKTLGTEISASDSEKRKLIIRLISRFSQTLRQIVVGDYRDEILKDNTELRIKFHVNEILKNLQESIKLEIPNLDTQEYEERLRVGISEMRGRELPGFGSTRVLLSTIATELEAWRLHVDNTLSQLFDLYTKTARLLAEKLTLQVFDTIVECVKTNCEIQTQEMLKRVDEIFLRSTESAAMDNDLIESINNIRFMRFETALREALLVAKEPEQPNPNGNNGVTISSTGSNNKELLKQHLLEILGPSYMTYHSVGQGPTLHLEDARAALKAFWRISERRLHEDVISVVEIILLKKSSEMVEQELLSIYQNWLLDPDELDSVLQENEVVVNERRKLKALKTSVEAALKQLDEVLPHCKAKSVEL